MRAIYLRAVLGIGILSAALAACGDGDTTGTGASTTTSNGGSGGSTSTTSTTDGGGGTTTSTGGGGGAGGTTNMGGGGNTGGSGNTGGEGGAGGATTYGFCAQPCANAVDCCPPSPMSPCPSDTYPNNFECKNGACYSGQCSSTADCTAINPNLDCLTFSGQKSCVFDCALDGDCMAPLTCTGVDDDGKKYCVFSGGGCTDDTSCGGFGKCVDKVCVCSSDTDCTVAGYEKCAL